MAKYFYQCVTFVKHVFKLMYYIWVYICFLLILCNAFILFSILFFVSKIYSSTYCIWPLIQNIYVASPLLMSLIIFAPTEVNAKMLLYCLICYKKCFDSVLSLSLINRDRNSGGSLYGDIFSFPFLQQFVYITSFLRQLSVWLRSLYQNIASQYLHW